MDTAAFDQQHHRQLAEDLLALETSEDRLSWLMERTPLHAKIPASNLDPARKVPGCLSGLWLAGEVRDGLCFFAAHSDSQLVHGVTSFVCDLYSSRSPQEIVQLGARLADLLRLNGLLSMTRKRALSSTIAFITSNAARLVTKESAVLTPAA